MSGLAVASRPEFVGRERELVTLADILSDPPALVLIEGEAGIGKSRLLREYLASPSATRHRALVAGCAPLTDPSSSVLCVAGYLDGVRHCARRAGQAHQRLGSGRLSPTHRKPVHPVAVGWEVCSDRCRFHVRHAPRHRAMNRKGIACPLGLVHGANQVQVELRTVEEPGTGGSRVADERDRAMPW